MNKAFRISYETVGASSYMAVALLPEAQLVNYQMEMILNNEIKPFLPIFKRVINGEVVIYYNITSRLPLSQILEKRKLTRRELFHLIEGAILAIREAASYRLPESGLLMDLEYIYVDPSSCKPGFMFLPVLNQEGQGVRELLQSLVMKGRIELSNDNFIQVLLEVLNEEQFSIDHLEKCLNSFMPRGSVSQGRGQSLNNNLYGRQGQRPLIIPDHKNSGMVPENRAGINDQEMRDNPAELRGGIPEPSGRPKPPSVHGKSEDSRRRAAPPDSGQLQENVQLDGSDSSELENGFDPEKAKKIFFLPQAVIMVALAASVSFGLFTDETGTIVINNILAAVILVVLVEVILYREAYVNSKKPKERREDKPKKEKKSPNASKQKKEKPAAKKKSKTSSKKRPVPLSGSRSADRMDSGNQGEAQQGSQGYPPETVPYRADGNGERQRQQYPNPVRQMTPSQQAVTDLYSPYSGGLDADYGSETQLYGTYTELSEPKMPAYLEYFENGRISRISLMKPDGIIIGRLRSQVDFAVTNMRVGKVHAKFFEQDGQYFVVDINSKNGTYINGNGKRINSNIPYLLHDNDRIMLADSEFTIRCPQ